MRLALVAPLGAPRTALPGPHIEAVGAIPIVSSVGMDPPVSAQPPSGDDDPTLRRTAFALAGVGMTNAVAALGGAALGWFADSKFDTTPIGILVGLVLGLACGILATWREVRTYLGN